MTIILCGLGRLWTDYFNQLLPSDARVSEAMRLEGLPESATVMVDYAFLASHQELLASLPAASRLLILMHRAYHQTDPLRMLTQVKPSGATLLCIDGGEIASCPLPTASLSCGVPLPNPRPPESGQKTARKTIALIGADCPAFTQLQSTASEDLAFRRIGSPENLSMEELQGELNNCALVVTGLAPDSSPSLICWIALASGIPVAANLSALKQRVQPEDSLLPIVQATDETLADVLTALTRDPRTLRDLSQRSITYMRNSRRIERTRNQLARILGSN